MRVLGGSGTFLRLAVTDCTAVPCVLNAGDQYDMEFDFTISADTAQIQFTMTLRLGLINLPIVDEVIPDSAASAGDTLRISYSIVPTGELSGVSVTKNMEVRNVWNKIVNIFILFLQSSFILRGEVSGASLEICRDVDCYMN